MNTTDNQKAINDFIDWVIEIKEFLCELLEAMYDVRRTSCSEKEEVRII